MCQQFNQIGSVHPVIGSSINDQWSFQTWATVYKFISNQTLDTSVKFVDHFVNAS